MCCMGERCFRVNCACICVRCRNCDDCERVFGKGGMALKLASKQLGSVSAGIVRSGRRPPPQTPQAKDPYLYNTPAYTSSRTYTQPPQPPPPGTPAPGTTTGTGHGSQMVKQASDSCCVQ